MNTSAAPMLHLKVTRKECLRFIHTMLEQGYFTHSDKAGNVSFHKNGQCSLHFAATKPKTGPCFVGIRLI